MYMVACSGGKQHFYKLDWWYNTLSTVSIDYWMKIRRCLGENEQTCPMIKNDLHHKSDDP